MIDYDKYLYSTGTHYISNSGKDEKGGISGGKAGDQTGHEWELIQWRNRPWSVVLRYPDQSVALTIAKLSIAAALNDKVGYDQSQRTTYWTQLKKAGYDPSRITTACEEDCTAGVSANVKAAGALHHIPALENLPICSSRNMRAEFTKVGFKALTASKYLTGYDYLMPGDILLYERHHAAANVTLGAAVVNEWHPGDQPVPEPSHHDLQRGDSGEDVRRMQLSLLRWNPDCLPKYGPDGDFGAETERAVKAFQASAGLPVTGIYDEATDKALNGGVSPKYVLVTGESVSIRSAPGAQHQRVGIVHRGDRLPYQDETYLLDETPWYLIIYNDDNGWISGKYSELEG